MSDNAIGWTDDQWSRVQQVVHDEAMNARVAASFLPLFGPLPGDTQVVPADRISSIASSPYFGISDERLAIDDLDTLRLSTVSVNVVLKSAQTADPELNSAISLLRRAANVIARVEDAIIFTGQNGEDGANGGADGIPPVYSVSGGGNYPGLVNSEVRIGVNDDSGAAVFVAVTEAVSALESQGYGGPFALVLGNHLFGLSNTPAEGSMALPRDRILPFLDGPLLRSSALAPSQGVLVSLQGAPIEIVVPSDIGVRYLQTTAEGKHVLRVSQRFVLRIKEANARALIEL